MAWPLRRRRPPPPRWRAAAAAAVLAAAAGAPLLRCPLAVAAAPALTKATPGDLTVTTVGAPTGNDEGRSVAVDAYGNVYVLAVTASRYGAADVAGLDGPDTDVLLVKLSASGRLLWRRRTGSPADDRPVGMALVGGWLVVVGQTYGDVTRGGDAAAGHPAAAAAAASAFVLCYDADSSRRVWARQWVPPAGGGHHSWNAVTAGADGEVWVAGHSGAGLFASAADAAAAADGGGRPPPVAVVVARLDGATGATLQAGSVVHPAGADASAVGVALTPDGVVVAAQTRSAAAGVAAGAPTVVVEDLLLVRLALDERLGSGGGSGSGGGGGDYPPALRATGVRVVSTASRYYVRGVAAGPPGSGLVYVVGSEHRAEATAHDVSVRAYTTAGLDDGPLTLVHDTAAGGRGGRDGGDETATSVAVLPGGRLVVGGAVKAVGGPTGGAAVVVTPSVWVVDPDTGGLVRFTTAAAAAGAGGWAEVTAVAVDADGDVVVAGYVNAGRETDVLAGLLGLPTAVKAPATAGGGRLPTGSGGGGGGGGGGAGAPPAGSLFVSGTDGLGGGGDTLAAGGGGGGGGGGGTSPATDRAYRVAVWAAVGAAAALGVAAAASCALKVRRDRAYVPAAGLAKLPGGAGLLSPKGSRAGGGRGAYRELYDGVDVD